MIYTLKVMFGFNGESIVNQGFLYLLSANFILLLVALIGSIPRTERMKRAIDLPLIQPIFLIAVLILSSAYLVGASYNPFLYFRF